MPNVTQTIPNFLGGVSKQPDTKKLPGQVSDCINAYPDPTFGLTKRPGFKFIKELGSSTAYTNGKWFYIHRDGDEKYIGVIKGAAINIWNATSGVACTITNTSTDGVAPTAYLTGTTANDYDVLTVQDTTIITNKKISITTRSAPSFTANTVGTIRLTAVTPNTTYTASIKIGSTTNTATFTTGDSATADGILTDLESDINGWSGDFNNLTVTRLDTSLEISSTVAFTLSGKGGADNERLETYQDQVANVTALPNRSKHHRIIKILNTSSSSDTYYSRFIADDGVSGSGYWEEYIAPNVSPGLNATTMPHELINTATNAFTFKQIVWTDRLVGDDETNTHPSFVGKKIQQAFFHSNRLGFLVNDNVSMSQANEFFNFYHVSAMTQIASDPIDLSCSSIRPTLLTGILPTAQGLILFSKNQQFLMYAPNGVFQPSTTIIRGISNYEMDINIDPVDNGDTINFVSKTPGYTRIYQMRTAGQEMNPTVLDIGRVVSEYIPSTITDLISSPQNSFIAMWGTDKNDVYFYRTHSDGQQEIMQSWFSWKAPGLVQTISVDSDVMYAVTTQGGKSTLLSASLNQTPEEQILVNSDGQKMNPCVDLYATATAVKYQGIDSFTITAGGSNYTSAPTVTITPILSSEGSGATATATVSGGAVTAITLTNAGNGYADGATVSFSGGGGSGAAATCTIYDGSKCYIPFTDDTDLTTVLVVGSDASDLTNPTFVESGFTVTPTRGSDSVGTYFSVSKKNLTSVASKVILGYKYNYDVVLPNLYYSLTPDGTRSDYTATLTIARMKFSMGLSGVLSFKLKRNGTSDYTDVSPTSLANFYKANDVPLAQESIVNVPIHQRNTNFTLTAYSDSPFPVSISSMMWEGFYSPRFYSRA